MPSYSELPSRLHSYSNSSQFCKCSFETKIHWGVLLINTAIPHFTSPCSASFNKNFSAWRWAAWFSPWRTHNTGQFWLLNNSISSFSTQPGTGDALVAGEVRVTQCHCPNSLWEKGGRENQVPWDSLKVSSCPTSELWLFYSLLCSCSRLQTLFWEQGMLPPPAFPDDQLLPTAFVNQLQTWNKSWPITAIPLVTYLPKIWQGQQEHFLRWIWNKSCCSANKKKKLKNQRLYPKLSLEPGLLSQAKFILITQHTAGKDSMIKEKLPRINPDKAASQPSRLSHLAAGSWRRQDAVK